MKAVSPTCRYTGDLLSTGLTQGTTSGASQQGWLAKCQVADLWNAISPVGPSWRVRIAWWRWVNRLGIPVSRATGAIPAGAISSDQITATSQGRSHRWGCGCTPNSVHSSSWQPRQNASASVSHLLRMLFCGELLKLGASQRMSTSSATHSRLQRRTWRTGGSSSSMTLPGVNCKISSRALRLSCPPQWPSCSLTRRSWRPPEVLATDAAGGGACSRRLRLRKARTR